MEAEYLTLSEAWQEALWLRQLLRSLGEVQLDPTLVVLVVRAVREEPQKSHGGVCVCCVEDTINYF